MKEPPGYSFNELIYDSNLLYGLGLMTWMFFVDISFDFRDVMLSTIAFVSINLAILLSGWAVLFGKAGPISAIGNLKAIFLTAAMALI